MSFCARCQHENVTGTLFCGYCGAPLAPRAGGAAADPFVGQTIKGVYHVQEKIGAGGMGDVYRAVHLALERPVAIKIMRRGLLSEPPLIRQFHREARAASKLRHPNVIAVHDFGKTDSGTLYMVMEYVTGRNLARVIAEESPISEGRIVHVGAQILSALSEAHANDLLHRDLKPENIMLESGRGAPDVVKVLDFGIAKTLQPDEAGSTLTRAGLLFGTPGYMSPEQLRGETLDGRSDLYAVGVILYEMLVGKLPFETAAPLAHTEWSASLRPQRPSARRGAPVGAGLEAVVMKALESAPGERFASAEEMRAALLACSPDAERARSAWSTLPRGTEMRATTPLVRATPERTPPRRARRYGVAAVALAAVAVAVAVYQVVRRAPPRAPARVVEAQPAIAATAHEEATAPAVAAPRADTAVPPTAMRGDRAQAAPDAAKPPTARRAPAREVKSTEVKSTLRPRELAEARPAPPAAQPAPRPEGDLPRVYETREVTSFEQLVGSSQAQARGRALVSDARWTVHPNGTIVFAPVEDLGGVFPMTLRYTRDGDVLSFQGMSLGRGRGSRAFVRVTGRMQIGGAPSVTLHIEFGPADAAGSPSGESTYHARARAALASR